MEGNESKWEKLTSDHESLTQENSGVSQGTVCELRLVEWSIAFGFQPHRHFVYIHKIKGSLWSPEAAKVV